MHRKLDNRIPSGKSIANKASIPFAPCYRRVRATAVSLSNISRFPRRTSSPVLLFLSSSSFFSSSCLSVSLFFCLNSIFLEISVSYFLTRIFASMILYSLMLSRLSISLSRWANLHHFPVFVISPDWHLLFPEKDDIGHNLFKLYLLGLAQLAREG